MITSWIHYDKLLACAYDVKSNCCRLKYLVLLLFYAVDTCYVYKLFYIYYTINKY